MTSFARQLDRGGTLLIARHQVRQLLSLDDCIAAVENAFLQHARGRTLRPGVLGVPSTDGGFHLKAAGMALEKTWFAVKCNGNFFHNTSRFAMPNIQGLVLLCDGDNGYPLAVIDSIEITILRTGAATAVAAKHLARPDAHVAAIFGCGNQGRVQLRALSRVVPLQRVLAFDTDPSSAASFALEMHEELGIRVEVTRKPSTAVRQSDICISCTPSKRYFLDSDDVQPGTFVAGVGADAEDKQELDPRLFGAATVVVDDLQQCASIGDLRHALAAGTITLENVHAELAALVSGSKPGRTSQNEITLFDSTGTALEDVGAAVTLYQRALQKDVGSWLDFSA